MKILKTTMCDGHEVVLEVGADGGLIFHGYDFDEDAEEAAIELGFEPSECFALVKQWRQRPLLMLAEEFELPPEVWGAILINWCESLRPVYEQAVGLAAQEEGEISLAPLEALRTMGAALYGEVELDNEETLRLWRGTEKALGQFKYLPDDMAGQSVMEAAAALTETVLDLFETGKLGTLGRSDWNSMIANKLLQARHYAAFANTSRGLGGYSSRWLSSVPVVEQWQYEMVRQAVAEAADWGDISNWQEMW
jgi:hypothetical protein